MQTESANTYHLSCQVVEIIYKEDQRIIKAVCHPGSLIIETAEGGQAQLGDKLRVTGTLRIDAVKLDNCKENE